MSAGLDLKATACRAHFRAVGRLRFPPNASNALRGVLGFALDPKLFKPVRNAGPSGLRNPPRPFVLHASHLNQVTVEAGGVFCVDIAVFYVDAEPFREALQTLTHFFLGPAIQEDFRTETVEFNLAARDCAPGRIRVRFLTPTEIKGHDNGGPPAFATLMARLRDRISALRSLYGPGPLAIDFERFLDAALEARLLGGEVIAHPGSRRSTRTGQTHPLAGFTGYADYEGDFRSYLPFLEAAATTGVGRQTVWGHGRLSVANVEHGCDDRLAAS